MKPLPVGRERDIQIAKLKRWVNVSIYKWSTSRLDALELWDELPEVKYWFEDKILGEHKVVFYENGVKTQVHGKDFADCVSSAYVAYKGGEK